MPSQTENDIALVEECKNGSQKAFNLIVNKYKDRVFNIAYRFLGNSSDAEDIMQECFISLHNNIKKFRGESALFTWIYRIAVNLSKNKLKSFSVKKNLRTVPVNETLKETNANRDNPHNILEKNETDKKLQDAISSLQPDWREVIVLFHIEELSYEEIATIAKCDIGTVKSRIHRARKELKEKLKDLI